MSLSTDRKTFTISRTISNWKKMLQNLWQEAHPPTLAVISGSRPVRNNLLRREQVKKSNNRIESNWNSKSNSNKKYMMLLNNKNWNKWEKTLVCSKESRITLKMCRSQKWSLCRSLNLIWVTWHLYRARTWWKIKKSQKTPLRRKYILNSNCFRIKMNSIAKKLRRSKIFLESEI